jgi:leucyl/phenylalanyl-tRNA--protein transferase
VALAYLVHFLKLHGVAMIDCQQETGHLASLGARPIARSIFLEHLKRAIARPRIRDWRPIPPVVAGGGNDGKADNRAGR